MGQFSQDMELGQRQQQLQEKGGEKEEGKTSFPSFLPLPAASSTALPAPHLPPPLPPTPGRKEEREDKKNRRNQGEGRGGLLLGSGAALLRVALDQALSFSPCPQTLPSVLFLSLLPSSSHSSVNFSASPSVVGMALEVEHCFHLEAGFSFPGDCALSLAFRGGPSGRASACVSQGERLCA